VSTVDGCFCISRRQLDVFEAEKGLVPLSFKWVYTTAAPSLSPTSFNGNIAAVRAPLRDHHTTLPTFAVSLNAIKMKDESKYSFFAYFLTAPLT